MLLSASLLALSNCSHVQRMWHGLSVSIEETKTTTAWYRDLSFDCDYPGKRPVVSTPKVTCTQNPDACAPFLRHCTRLCLTLQCCHWLISTVQFHSEELPNVLGTLYDATLQLVSYEDVVAYCASLDVSVSTEQVRFMLSQTKQQAMNL